MAEYEGTDRERLRKRDEARARVPSTMRKAQTVHEAARRQERQAWQQARSALQDFLGRLHRFRVLDPACGSGNFLYLSLLRLKDLEHLVLVQAEELALEQAVPFIPLVGPEALYGIEINEYAAELARVTVWIGHIQWMLWHGYSLLGRPIMKPLDQIYCRDALLKDDGTEAEWPEVDAIVGNPPFLGMKEMVDEMGAPYVEQLRRVYANRVPATADLMCYWFAKANKSLLEGRASRAGTRGEKTITQPYSNPVLKRLADHHPIVFRMVKSAMDG